MAKFWLENNEVCSDEDLSAFDEYQIEEIRYGLERGYDVSFYARPEFNLQQMKQICLGLETGVDVSVYAKPEFTPEQMDQIWQGLLLKLDVSIYAKPEFRVDQMQRIRMYLESGKSPEEAIKEEKEISDGFALLMSLF